jgi:cystathionine beta-lyase
LASGEHIGQPQLGTLRRRRSEKWRVYPKDVLPAFVAETDFELAPPIRDALMEAVRIGDTGYAHAGGLAEAFVGFERALFGWAPDPARVVLMPDVLIGVAEMIRVLTEPGESVVIDTPAYPPFWPVVREYGRQIVEVPLLHDGPGWRIDLDGLEAAFRGGAAAYLLCNPHNPTGSVHPRDDLASIAALAARYDVAVVVDEIHAPLMLPGATHTPFVSLGDASAIRAVTVTSASKAFNLPGLKCAVAIAGSDRVRERFATLPEDLAARAGIFGVIASIAAFTDGLPWLRAVVAHIDGNRRLLAELLAERVPGISYVPPEATYLAWLDCRGLGLGPDPAHVFLERGRVALTSGLAFGAQGAGYARLNMGTSPELLTDAIDRIAKAVGTKASDAVAAG